MIIDPEDCKKVICNNCNEKIAYDNKSTTLALYHLNHSHHITQRNHKDIFQRKSHIRLYLADESDFTEDYN